MAMPEKRLFHIVAKYRRDRVEGYILAPSPEEAVRQFGGPVAEKAHETGMLTVTLVEGDNARELLRQAEAEKRRRKLWSAPSSTA
jgi:hypothetical protein